MPKVLRQGRESQVGAPSPLRRVFEPAQEEPRPPRAPVRNPEDAETAAQALRDSWRLGDQPIESVTAAIEDGGGIVVEDGGEDDLFDGLSGWAPQ